MKTKLDNLFSVDEKYNTADIDVAFSSKSDQLIMIAEVPPIRLIF